MNSPLEGVRVLDFSRVLSGPYASMMLADLGADVVKIEDPRGGDDTRSFGPPFVDGVSTYYLSINRGKRSVTLDLKHPEDLQTALRLAAVADVVLENFRPGVMARLGLGADKLRALNPRLVYCAISGFGQGSDRAGYDLVVQGLSGIPSITGEPGGPPLKSGASVADLVTGLNAAQGILAALVRRGRTGEGALVDVPMIDGQLAMLTYHASNWLNARRAPARMGNQHPSIHPYSCFPTSDGWLNLAIGNDRLWVSFCQAAGVPDWATDVRFATNRARVENRAALDEVLFPMMASKSRAAWQALLDEAGVPAGPMLSVPEALEGATLVEHAHPDTGAPLRSVVLPYQIDEVPRASSRRAPRLGEHSAEVLGEWLG